jgi:ABC-2 type transport system ATP-binding protein
MDEAERCHYLAILDSGKKCADDTPKQLMETMKANVVEVSGEHLRQLKQALEALPEVLSTAQQGVRLRLLVHKRIADPVEWLRQQNIAELENRDLQLVRPSLEDVFVTSTGKHME